MTDATPHGDASAAAADSAAPAAAPDRTDGAGSGGEFTVHWGRTAVALIVALALLTTLIAGLLVGLGVASGPVPLLSGGVALLGVATLRTMAVVRRRRRRRARLDEALREAMNPDVEASGLRRPSVPTTDRAVAEARTPPFDALTHDASGRGGPGSLQELDADGLPLQLGRTFADAPHEQPVPPAAHAASPARAWEPREVPKPKYLEARAAERPAPEPLVPEEPRPEGEVKLKDAAAQIRAEQQEAAGEAPEGADGAAAADEVREMPRPRRQTAVQDSLDLDAVLKRRRA
ncbi:hypothetical protein [Nesterenkonia halophila]|uniref:hypothetical protein n=1 Tax=Nesterenkonia halophila TaxID=302044 RepID=UPI0012912D35|nr:hypothetical protein [Nesterenkonia halophila]